jgi:hypothetical protein
MALSLISLSLITFRTLDSVICKRWFEDIYIYIVSHCTIAFPLMTIYNKTISCLPSFLYYFFIFLMKLEKRKVQEIDGYIFYFILGRSWNMAHHLLNASYFFLPCSWMSPSMARRIYRFLLFCSCASHVMSADTVPRWWFPQFFQYSSF